MATEAERIISKADVQGSPGVSNLARRIEFPVESAMMRAIVAGEPLEYAHSMRIHQDFKVDDLFRRMVRRHPEVS